MFEKLEDLCLDLRARVIGYFMLRKTKKRMKSYTSIDDHIMAGDIILMRNVADPMLQEAAVKLNHRIHRLYYHLNSFNKGKTVTPKIIVDKEIELINKAVSELEARMEAKRGVM